MFLRLTTFATSSIGKKAFMSISGLLLIGFLVAHVAGNLTLFVDGDGSTFDAYANTLRTNPLLPVLEIGLTALFLTHIALGMRTALENSRARPVRYKQLNAHGNRTWSSTSMIITGVIVLIFLVIHLYDFRLTAGEDDLLAPMVVARLSTPLGAGIYFIGVGALGVHLWHAFQSLFQTLGFHHSRYRPLIRAVGWGVAALLAVLFWLFPTLCLAQPERWDFSEVQSVEAADDTGHDTEGGH
jgi:succinate dehydrogenase / fumarate reductase cytochrome b subunit